MSGKLVMCFQSNMDLDTVHLKFQSKQILMLHSQINLVFQIMPLLIQALFNQDFLLIWMYQIFGLVETKKLFLHNLLVDMDFFRADYLRFSSEMVSVVPAQIHFIAGSDHVLGQYLI